MIAGTLGLLDEPADGPLETEYEADSHALVVDKEQAFLDGQSVQAGIVAGPVVAKDEHIVIGDSSVSVERPERQKTVASDWVADVDGDGWILSERTFSGQFDDVAPWPFHSIQGYADGDVTVSPAVLDTEQFRKRQREANRMVDVAMVTGSAGDDATSISWGRSARATDDADVGFAGTVEWHSMPVELCLYESGYIAFWGPDTLTIDEAGRFISEEILPVARVADDDIKGDQTSLEDHDNSTRQATDGGQSTTRVEVAAEEIATDIIAGRSHSPRVAADYAAEQQGLTHRLDELVEQVYNELRFQGELQRVARDVHGYGGGS